MVKIPRFVLAATLALCAGSAFAQQPAPAAEEPALTEEQRAQLARQDAEMSQAALQVMQLVDAERLGEIWDGASPVMQQAVTRDDFVRQISSDRAALGAVSARANAVVSRTQGQAGGPVPEGLYINVQTATRFANQPEPVRELVSFRLDEDRTWRVSGYTLR
jgi:hypothetical protein